MQEKEGLRQAQAHKGTDQTVILPPFFHYDTISLVNLNLVKFHRLSYVLIIKKNSTY